jgi:DedD protein
MKKGWSDFMDRRVKERLVGATILVVLIVLIVPELLSGPKPKLAVPPPVAVRPEEPVGPPPVRNVTVDLATSQATQEAETATASAAAPPPTDTPAAPSSASVEDTPPEPAARDEPVPPAGAMHRRDQAPPTITTLRAQQAAPHALEKELSSPKSATVPPSSSASREPAPAAVPHHGWAVQLGSFASRANAETLVHRLKAHASSAYVSSSGKGAALRYRVRIGPLADRGAAERARLKLIKEGYSASLVQP